MYKPRLRSSLHQRQSQFARCQSAFTNRRKAFRVASKERKEFNLSNCSKHNCSRRVFRSPHMETDGNALVCLSATGYQSTQKIKTKGKKRKEKANKKKASWQTQRKFKPLVSHLDVGPEIGHIFVSRGVHIVNRSYYIISTQQNNDWDKHRAEED